MRMKGDEMKDIFEHLQQYVHVYVPKSIKCSQISLLNTIAVAILD